MSSVPSIWFETTTPPPGSLSCQATPNSWRSIRVLASNPIRRIVPRFSSPTQKGVAHSPRNDTSSGTERVVARIVRSVSARNCVGPTRSVKPPVKVMLGWFSTSKKSALRRCASRSGSPVHSLVASKWPSKRVCLQSPRSKSSSPRMSLKRPRTQVTIMCRARNSASEWPGSKIHLAMLNGSRHQKVERSTEYHETVARPVRTVARTTLYANGLGRYRNSASELHARLAPRVVRQKDRGGGTHCPPCSRTSAPPAGAGSSRSFYFRGRPEPKRKPQLHGSVGDKGEAGDAAGESSGGVPR